MGFRLLQITCRDVTLWRLYPTDVTLWRLYEPRHTVAFLPNRRHIVASLRTPSHCGVSTKPVIGNSEDRFLIPKDEKQSKD